MRYVVLFAAIAAGIMLLGLILAAGVVVLRAVSADPGLFWIPGLVIAAFLIATLVVAVDYLGGRPEGPLA